MIHNLNMIQNLQNIRGKIINPSKVSNNQVIMKVATRLVKKNIQ